MTALFVIAALLEFVPAESEPVGNAKTWRAHSPSVKIWQEEDVSDKETSSERPKNNSTSLSSPQFFNLGNSGASRYGYQRGSENVADVELVDWCILMNRARIPPVRAA